MNQIDFSKMYNSDNKSFHSSFFPKNIMAVIAGKTGSGKTQLLINLLIQEGILNYSFVHIYSPTLYQDAYVFLRKYYEELSHYILVTTGKTVMIGHFHSSDDEIVDPSKLDKNYHHIMVFDDVMLEDQFIIRDYFCRGRHNNISCFYLVQSLHKIAKHCIRDNCNVFILFQQDNKTLKYFYETHICDMSWDEFRKFCCTAWKKKHGFITINLFDESQSGRYLDNYKSIYIPNKYL